ncbi:energy-coupling factor ABC transporter ATP-binding protein [Bacillus solimangrovi]|uniref:Energy-coupling factor transporter ATPase n=1 Tax=Bacillus solimangrovi TaxID=1305675 RepID=A0A1E5LGK9_9BACI|nr:energy-coupling factor ABC transporter ATP-binding protein [Bacillus solimangrovi]OEH93218.1 energy-coupling factor transporter ATPase [Bacillus solimangrovi]
MDKLLSVNNLYYKYPNAEKWALEDVNLSLKRGEWTAVVGHNGSGKSTLAKLLNGLLIPEQGNVVLDDDIEVNEDTVWEVRKRVGMVFQNPDNQFVGATVRDDVAFGLENIGIPREEMVKRIEHALQDVKMTDFLNQEPHHLSGGQKQRVAIAGIIALQPSLMILDESTSMLDPSGRKEVVETVRDLQRKTEMTVISITHELEEIIEADRVIVMNQGKVYKEGTPHELFEQADELTEIGLDLPFTIQLSRELEKCGIDVDGVYLTHGEMVDRLWKLYSKM